MKYTFLLLFIGFASVIAQPSDLQANKPASSVSSETLWNELLAEDAFVFYVIGDWGRKGKYHQRQVATAMNKCAEKIPPRFIVSTGDNFYTFGVRSTKDRLWKDSYERIYNGDAIKNIDWYPVLGNHDHYGNEQAEIEYSKVNSHWKMPGEYFAAEFETSDNSTLAFVFTNTERLVQGSNPASEQQWKFIDSTLAATKATWKFVVGHHPVYSSSPMHGDTEALIEKLKPVLEKHKVQAYFCGHDHDLQHQKPAGSKVDYFVSGAGSELRPAASYQHTLFAKSIAGFALVAIHQNTMKVYFIDENADIIYQYSSPRQ